MRELMQRLASFIMSGRTQAAIVALVGSWLPLISPAAVALVTLRRGAFDGTQVVIFALLPALAGLWLKDIGVLLPLVTVLGLVVVFLASLHLRATGSWGHALMAATALSVFASGLTLLLVDNPTEDLAYAMRQVFGQMESGAEPAVLADNSAVLGLMAMVLVFGNVLALMLGRWWQSLLYNPGGFREEMHQLRLSQVQALVSFVAVAYCLTQTGYSSWAVVFAMPLFFTGLGLIHGIAGRTAFGGQILAPVYLGLILFLPFGLMAITLIAFIDTWINFRARMQPPEA